MKNFLVTGVSAVLATAFSLPLSAATILSSEATFQAATGAVAEPAIPDTGVQPGDTGTVGNLTFSVDGTSTTELYFGLPGSEWSTLLPGNDIALSGPEDMTITSAMALTAIGFYIDEPTTPGGGNTDVCNAPCFPTVFDVSFYLGGTFLENVSIIPNGQLAYFGFELTSPFDRVEIFDVTSTIDNEFFGGFSIAKAPPAVPLPAGLPLLLAGLGGLALLRRRHG